MPDNNDYLSQLLERVNQKLNDSEDDGRPASPSVSAPNEPLKPRVFTSGGRFDNVPSSDPQPEEEKKPAAAPVAAVSPASAPAAPVHEAVSAKPQVPATDTEEDEEDDQYDYPEDNEEDPSRNPEKTDEKTFSLSPDSTGSPQPADDPEKESENVFDWNVSEDVEKYLSSGDGASIFERMPEKTEKKSGKARRAERRKLKENTRQLMDRNSGERRGCFGTFFHLVFILIMVALTILAVLYVLQTIADVTIIDINSILTNFMAKVSELLAKYLPSIFG